MSKEEKQQARYKVYLDQHKSLIDLEVEASKSFDHWIVTLAGGALAISITFIEKIAPHPRSDTLCWLGFSWGFLLLTILFTLSSHLTSQSGMRRQRDILDLELEKYPTELLPHERTNRFAIITNWLNIASMVTFALGIICLCVFSLSNPPQKEISNERKQTVGVEAGRIKEGHCSPDSAKTDTTSKTRNTTTTQEVKEGSSK
ncbi:MAG: hypothetical protein NTY01_10165 [Verrucomicrobia bacterium]|nr:hypothetical protein [Verrucomicrobiota bacterium]